MLILSYRQYQWSKRVVQFGDNPNQIHHTFRHVDKMGIDRSIVKDNILNDVRTLSDIPTGQAINRVINISGK